VGAEASIKVSGVRAGVGVRLKLIQHRLGLEQVAPCAVDADLASPPRSRCPNTTGASATCDELDRTGSRPIIVDGDPQRMGFSTPYRANDHGRCLRDDWAARRRAADLRGRVGDAKRPFPVEDAEWGRRAPASSRVQAHGFTLRCSSCWACVLPSLERGHSPATHAVRVFD